MKKIGFVETVGHGLYNFRGGVIKELCNLGYKVYIIAPPFKESTIMKEWGCEYIPIKIERLGKNPLEALKIILKLKKIYLELKLDLVFHYSIKPNIYGGIASQIAKIDYIGVIPGAGRIFHSKNITFQIVKILYKISFRKVKKVLFLNEDDLEIFVKEKILEKEKTLNIRSEGVNIKKFKPSLIENYNKETKFLMISRLNKEKGIFEYFGAAKIIKSKFKNVEFYLLGSIGEIKEEVLKKYLSSGEVKYLGVTEFVEEVIDKMDCIVLPSYREGVPRTLLEAGAMGKPLISSECIGAKDVVEDGYNGFLCKIKDKKDLAIKIEKFIKLSKEEKKKFGENSRKKIVKEFDEERIIKIYKTFL